MIPVALHQFRDLVGSARFQICALILLAFFALNGVVYGWRLDGLAEEVGRMDASIAEIYDSVDTVSGAARQWYRVLLRPLGTEFICEGGTRWFNDTGWVSPGTGGSPGAGKVLTINNWMVPYDLVDWAFIVQVVVSFLAILLAYDSVSGERERGTLKLMLANPVSRAHILAGKLIAYLAALLAAVAAGSLLSLALVVSRGYVVLSARLVGGYLLFLVAAGLYCAAILLGCMGASALLRRSGTVLMGLVFAWAVLILVVPQVAYLVGSGTSDALSRTWERERELTQQTRAALQAEGIVPRQRGAAAVDGYAVERRYAQRMRALDAELSQLNRAGLQGEIRQYETTRLLARLSPGYALRGALEAFLGTGSERYAHFLDQVWDYRLVLQEFLRGRDAADPDSPHLTFVPEYMSEQPLDSPDIPRFAGRRLDLAESVGRGAVPVALLALETLAALFFALWAFSRAEA